MRRRLWLALLLTLCVLCVSSWWLAPSLVRRLVFTAPNTDTHQQAELVDIAGLQYSVAKAMPSLGLREDQRQERTEQQQQDSQGAWTTIHEHWRLSSDADPLALARRLEALVASSDDSAEIYVVEQQAQQVQVRFYAGSRLAQVLELEPSLGPWPSLAPFETPLLALVVWDVDNDPHGVRLLMERGAPMALALSPYSPFTLRFSRDALLTHTEVLAIAEEDVSLPESLDAVPHASGLLLLSAPQGDPETTAAALLRANVYVLDAVQAGLGAQWLRAFQEHEVPYLRAQTIHSDVDRRRYRHSAARQGAAVVVTPAARGSLEADELNAAAQRGYRVAFPAEVIEALRD